MSGAVPSRPGPGWLAGFVTAGVLAAIIGGAIGALVVFGGLYNVAATSPHYRVVAWAIHRTMISSVRNRSTADAGMAPITADRLLAGARVYRDHCVMCHGGPGVARAAWTPGMMPTPPYLIDSPTRWSRAELRTIIAGGVKMTGMPAWEQVLPREQVEAVTDLVYAMPHFTAAKFEALMATAQPGQAGRS